MIMRGKALRQAIIIRALAVERLFRAMVIVLAAYAVWKFRGARGAIQATLDRDLPIFRAAGFKVDQMTIVHELEKALAAKPSTLALLTLMLAGYALLEVVEGVGLWLLKRWGEYFAVIATSVFLPLEIHDLAKGITMTRVVTFTINVAAVIYLLISNVCSACAAGARPTTRNGAASSCSTSSGPRPGPESAARPLFRRRSGMNENTLGLHRDAVLVGQVTDGERLDALHTLDMSLGP